MPTPDGKLTAEELQRAFAWLERHWRHRMCPVCATSGWYVDTSLARVDVASAAPFGGPFFTHVLVSCKTCGYTMFFASKPMGIFAHGVAAEPTPEQSPAEGKPNA